MIKRYLFFLSIVALSNVKLVSNEQYFGFRAFNASAYKSSALLHSLELKVVKRAKSNVLPLSLLRYEVMTFLYTFQSKLYSIAPRYAPQHFQDYPRTAMQYFQQRKVAYRNKSSYIMNFLKRYPSNPMLLSDVARLLHEMDMELYALDFYSQSLSIDGLAANNMANYYVETKHLHFAERLYQMSILVRLSSLNFGKCEHWDVIDDFHNFRAVDTWYKLSNDTSIVSSFLIFVGGFSGHLLSAKYCQLYLGNQRYMNKFRYKKPNSVHDIKRVDTVKCNATISFLQGWRDNYYHFLLEIVPNFFVVEELLSKHFFRFESICILMPKIKRESIYEEVLSKTNITANSHVTVILHSTSTSRGEVLFRTRRHISICWLQERLRHNKNSFWFSLDGISNHNTFPTMYPSSLFVPSLYMVSQLRSKLSFTKLFNISRNILYAARAGSKRSNVVGEEVILSAFKLRYNELFQVFYGSNMSLLEQANLFHAALVVMGAHGAALSNIVFCRSDVLIIEFPLSPPSEGVYFKFISKLLCLRYVAPSMASMRYLGDLVLRPNTVMLLMRMVDRWLFRPRL